MKYAVIAALLATNTQALTGCKKGLGAKIYSDSKCKEDANAEHTLLDDDVAKTGKCVSHKATKEDKEALAFAKTTLADKEKADVDATKKYERCTDLDVFKTGETTPGTDRENLISVEDKYDKHYQAIKAAWIKSEASKAKVAAYIDKNPSATTKVNQFQAAYKALWILEDVKEGDREETDITAQKAVVKPLEEALPENADKALLKQAVKDEKAFDDQMKVVDGDDVVNFKKYLKLDKATDDAKVAVTDQKNVLATAENKVDDHTFPFSLPAMPRLVSTLRSGMARNARVIHKQITPLNGANAPSSVMSTTRLPVPLLSRLLPSLLLPSPALSSETFDRPTMQTNCISYLSKH